jgi:hypothetical protein
MSGTSGIRVGRVRVVTVDVTEAVPRPRPDGSALVLGDLAPTRDSREVHRDGTPVRLYVSSPRRKTGKGPAPMMHTVHGAGYVNSPPEAGR